MNEREKLNQLIELSIRNHFDIEISKYLEEENKNKDYDYFDLEIKSNEIIINGSFSKNENENDIEFLGSYTISSRNHDHNNLIEIISNNENLEIIKIMNELSDLDDIEIYQ